MLISMHQIMERPRRQFAFREGVIDLDPGSPSDMLSGAFSIASVSFQETNADPKLASFHFGRPSGT
jgi:hypothetical protein